MQALFYITLLTCQLPLLAASMIISSDKDQPPLYSFCYPDGCGSPVEYTSYFNLENNVYSFFLAQNDRPITPKVEFNGNQIVVTEMKYPYKQERLSVPIAKTHSSIPAYISIIALGKYGKTYCGHYLSLTEDGIRSVTSRKLKNKPNPAAVCAAMKPKKPTLIIDLDAYLIRTEGPDWKSRLFSHFNSATGEVYTQEEFEKSKVPSEAIEE